MNSKSHKRTKRKQTTIAFHLLVLPDSPEAFVVNGLVILGVFRPAELSLGVHVYKFSNISVRLISLLTY